MLENEDKQACVQQQYRLRTTELQARYRLVPERGPFRFACDGTPPTRWSLLSTRPSL
ncbi:hypothetical protein MBH78_18370 [Oceanimonas sp. NS1]|nr:hypothetical protein [Oceanimonas sp. NS1]